MDHSAQHKLTRMSQEQLERTALLHKEFMMGRSGIKATLKFMDLTELDFRGLNFSRAEFVSCDFGGSICKDAKFIQSEMFRCWFHNANMSGADLNSADMRGSNFFQADLSNTVMIGADLRAAGLGDQAGFNDTVCNFLEADLSNANMTQAKIRYGIFKDVAFHKTLLSNADLRDTDCTYADFREANLDATRLMDANLEGASFVNCSMNGTDFSTSVKPARRISPERLQEILKEHKDWVKTNGERGKRAKLHRVDLSEMDLSGKFLAMVDFEGAILVETNLKNAVLAACNFKKANMRRAQMNGADIRSSDFRGARVCENHLETALSGALPTMKMATRVGALT